MQVLGLYEGPTESWLPLQDRLADALRRAGAPTNLLHAVLTGGRASLEPDPGWFPREQFSGNPAEALALALEMLLEETAGGRPAEWFSTLRVLEYREDLRTETLLQVEADGIRCVTREQPWSPIPKPRWADLLREQWWILLLIACGIGIGGWLQRERIRGYWIQFQDVVLADDFAMAEDFKIELDGFATYLEMSMELSVDGERLILLLERRADFPDSPAALDLARAQASMTQAAALMAIEFGHAELVLIFLDGRRDQRKIPLNGWQDDGKYHLEIPTGDWKDRQLQKATLQP